MFPSDILSLFDDDITNVFRLDDMAHDSELAPHFRLFIVLPLITQMLEINYGTQCYIVLLLPTFHIYS